MLYAWGHHKRRGEHGEYEDEVVSAVFGPLRYVSASSRTRILEKIIATAFGNQSPLDITNGVNSCDLEFWPNIASFSKVEPDVVILARTASGNKLRILIEAKLDAPLSENQLYIQWDAARKFYGCDVWQIFLTKQSCSETQMVDGAKGTTHVEYLANVRWSDIARSAWSLRAANYLDPGAREWAKDVYCFLAALKQAPFSGFRDVFAASVLGTWSVSWQYHAVLIDLTRLIRVSGLGNGLTFKTAWAFDAPTLRRMK